jgi:BlaI family transcriptional regulator, penicillinase repressor
MASSPELSDLQLDVVRVLWARREATSAEVQASLDRSRGLALTTISTILTRLERRGVVTHRVEGRQHIYRARVSEGDVRRSMLGSLVDSVFQGDPTALVSQLLSADDLSPGDLDRIRELINQAESERKEPDGS